MMERISGLFWKSDDAVFSERTKLALDPATTRVYFGTWATDGKRVYRWSFERRMIDPKTFKPLNNLYAKDAKACYAGPKKIAGADPKTFEVLDAGLTDMSLVAGDNQPDGYARDRKNVYHNGNRVTGADPKSFISLGNRFGHDKQHVFYNQYKLQSANIHRWRPLALLYSQDDEQVFYENRPVRNADAESFVVLDYGRPHFAYDGKHLFCNGRLSSTEEYAKDLERTGASLGEHAEFVRSGKWEELRRQQNRSYEAPRVENKE